MKSVKNVTIAVLLILAVVVVLQNTEAVEIKLLFMKLSMSRAQLLLITFVAGVVVGLLSGAQRPSFGAKQV